MKFFSFILILFLSITSSYSQESQILYVNNFNTINNVNTSSSCSPNIKYNKVNDLFVNTGSGLYKAAKFGQKATVEIVDNYLPSGNIFDPQQKAGNYSITMQTANPEDDLVSLTFNTTDVMMYRYINFNFDVSATDILTPYRCGIRGVISAPKMLISIYWHSGATFNFSSRGTLLAQDTLEGNPPSSTYVNRQFDTYNWKNVTARLSLEKLTATTGYITIVVDAIAGNYTAIDNFRISADMEPLPIYLIDFKGHKEADNNVLEWNVADAKHFSHFEIEAADLNNNYKFQFVEKLYFDETTSHYSYQDKGDIDKIYRIKLVDIDGSFFYSEAIKIKGAHPQIDIQLLPNPAHSYIMLNNAPVGGNYKILNAQGKLLKEGLIVTPDRQEININNYQPGLYNILIQNGDAQTIKKFIKY